MKFLYLTVFLFGFLSLAVCFPADENKQDKGKNTAEASTSKANEKPETNAAGNDESKISTRMYEETTTKSKEVRISGGGTGKSSSNKKRVVRVKYGDGNESTIIEENDVSAPELPEVLDSEELLQTILALNEAKKKKALAKAEAEKKAKEEAKAKLIKEAHDRLKKLQEEKELEEAKATIKKLEEAHQTRALEKAKQKAKAKEEQTKELENALLQIYSMLEQCKAEQQSMEAEMKKNEEEKKKKEKEQEFQNLVKILGHDKFKAAQNSLLSICIKENEKETIELDKNALKTLFDNLEDEDLKSKSTWERIEQKISKLHKIKPMEALINSVLNTYKEKNLTYD